MAFWIWLLLALLLLLAISAIHHFNRGVSLQNRCDESWSNVDTELLRRHELIPNLVAAVKGYAKHESQVMQAVTKARALAQRGAPAKEQGASEQALDRALGRMLAVAEAHPELKASKNFLQLQEELVLTEDRIQAARRFYNANVRDYANLIRQFPGNLFAALYRFKPRDFFEVEGSVASAPKVRA